MSSSLLLQQCTEYLVRLTWIVFVMGGRWPYSCCFVGCCLQDLFNIALRILVCRQAFSDFHMTDRLWTAVHAFASFVLTPFSVDKTLLPYKVNLSICFKGPPISAEMWPFLLKHMYYVLSVLTWWPMPAAAHWASVFSRSAMSLV